MNTRDAASFMQFMYRDVPLSLLARICSGRPEFPWSHFCKAFQLAHRDLETSLVLLKEIMEGEEVSTRSKLWAASCYCELESMEQTNQVQGIVLELRKATSVDTFAFYRDGTLRFIDSIGNMMIFEDRDQIVARFATTVLDNAEPLLERAPIFPESNGGVTFTLMTLSHSQVLWCPDELLGNDALLSSVFFSATRLLSSLSQTYLHTIH